MSQPSTNYKPLFYIGLAITTASLVVTFFTLRRAHQAEAKLGQSQLVNPNELVQMRDQNYSFTITNYGYTYKGKTGDLIDDFILVYGAWEKDILFFMRDYVQATKSADSVFLDVGSNTGQHSLFMSRIVKQVHAFDPYPPVNNRFKDMIALNGFQNIVLHEVGLGDKEALLPFFMPLATNEGGGTFRKTIQEKEKLEEYSKLKIVVGDAYLKSQNLPKISLIKMDIEGYEEMGLRGLRATLAKDRPLIVVEISTPPTGTFASLEQLQAAFPDNYGLLFFRKGREFLISGNYELHEFPTIADQFFRSDLQIDLVAYPRENESLVPRRRTAAAIP